MMSKQDFDPASLTLLHCGHIVEMMEAGYSIDLVSETYNVPVEIIKRLMKHKREVLKVVADVYN